MKNSKTSSLLKLAMFLVFAAFQGCATMNAPVKQMLPGQENFLGKKYKDSTLQFVLNENGLPGAQGHWGAAEYAFMVVYPIGTEGTMPTWQFNVIKKNEGLKCYVFLFNKESGNKLSSVEEKSCIGFGSEPDRVDWDYVKAKG